MNLCSGSLSSRLSESIFIPKKTIEVDVPATLSVATGWPSSSYRGIVTFSASDSTCEAGGVHKRNNCLGSGGYLKFLCWPWPKNGHLLQHGKFWGQMATQKVAPYHNTMCPAVRSQGGGDHWDAQGPDGRRYSGLTWTQELPPCGPIELCGLVNS